jgi:hypothetical protein
MKPLFILTPFLVGLYSLVVAPLAESGMTPGAVQHSPTGLADIGEHLPSDLPSSDSTKLQLAVPQHAQVTAVSFLGASADRFSIQSNPSAISRRDKAGFKVFLDSGNHPRPVNASIGVTADNP